MDQQQQKTVPPLKNLPPEPVSGGSRAARKEEGNLEDHFQAIHTIRKTAAYGSLFFVALLYGFGVYTIAFFLGLTCHAEMIDSEGWHIVVAVLVALFSVPTFVLIATLKSVSQNKSDMPDNFHEYLGQILEKLVDKIISK